MLNQTKRLFFVGFVGTSFTPELRDYIGDLWPAGVILFSRNIEDPIQVAELNSSLQKFYSDKGRRLIIGVDQESGRVARLKKPLTEFPPAYTMACDSRAEELVTAYARTTALELRMLGFNLDFAPVMDVLFDEDNLEETVIGDRSFGVDPVWAAKLGAKIIATFRESGLIPCAKHFPGHGGTKVDSHVRMPVDNSDADTISNLHLYPFREAARIGAEMFMTAHVLYTKLDPDNPATYSEYILQEVLRRDLAFEGLVITDDLGMGALSNDSIAQSALKAFKAGADLLLICNEPDEALNAARLLESQVAENAALEARAAESLRRIDQLLLKYGSSFEPADPATVKRYFSRETLV
jgi:beta-N-acetylhexosaminidase